MSIIGLGSETEGDKQLKAANKLVQSSILSLRFKPDWEAATPLFEKAAQNFLQSKAHQKAIAAYEQAAQGQERLNSPWHAAKHLEKAGECCKELGQLSDVPRWFERAADSYEEAGRGQAAAEALSKGARAMEESDAEAASKLYGRAVKSLEAEGKAGAAANIFRHATGNELRREDWAAAVGFQLRWAVACEDAQAITSQCRAYVAAIILWLAGADARNAYSTYQDGLGVSAFTTSQEAFAAEELLNAYRAADAEKIKGLLRPTSMFYNIDNQISRLVKKLPVGDLAQMAADLEVVSGKQFSSLHLAGSDDDLDLT